MDGQEGSQRVWEANWRVKRPPEGSERLTRGSGGQPEGLGVSQRVWGVRQRVWEVSQGVWKLKLVGTEKCRNVETRNVSLGHFRRVSAVFTFTEEQF